MSAMIWLWIGSKEPMHTLVYNYSILSTFSLVPQTNINHNTSKIMLDFYHN